MQCERAQNLINASLDRPLAADESRDLAGHVAACGPCREDKRQSLELRSLFREDRATLPQPSADLNARIMARVRRGDEVETRVFSMSRLRQWAAAAAVMIAMIGGGFYLGRQTTAAGVDDLTRSIESSKADVIAKGADPTAVDKVFKSYEEAREKIAADAERKYAEAYENLDRQLKNLTAPKAEPSKK